MQSAVQKASSAPSSVLQSCRSKDATALSVYATAMKVHHKPRCCTVRRLSGNADHSLYRLRRQRVLETCRLPVRAASNATAMEMVSEEAKSATLYDVLGVSREASTDDIHAAYKTQKKQIKDTMGPDAKDALDRLEVAYDELREPESRRLYDFGLANQAVGEGPFVWPYEVDVTQRITAETKQNFKETADPKLFEGFDNDGLSDDEQFDLTSDLIILGVLLSIIISAALKLSGIGLNSLNSLQEAGETAVEMWEKLGP